MRTNDNAAAIGVIVVAIAISLSMVAFGTTLGSLRDIGKLEVRVAELEETAAINQLSNTHLLKILGSLTNIVGELELRLHPAEEKQ